MKITNKIEGTPTEQLESMWGQVKTLLIERYKIGVLAPMDGPNDVNYVEGRKIVLSSKRITVVDRDPKVLAAVIASQLDSEGRRPAYVAAYEFIENFQTDPGTFTKEPDTLKVGFAYQ